MSKEKGILEVIQYSVGRKRRSFGHGYEAAYHSIRLGDKEIKGQREISKRFDNLDFDFKDKTVLDLGCSTGGMLHYLAGQIKSGIGMDYNSKCINAANLISRFNGTAALSFYTFNLDKDPLNLIKDFVVTDHVDICFVLSIALWVKKWKEVVQECHKLSECLLYEAHGKEDFKKEQIDYLKTLYPNVILVAAQALDDYESVNSKGKLNRMTFLCKR
jgi:SAM-dependent methyltransferase